MAEGRRPAQSSQEHGEWEKGWQREAARARDGSAFDAYLAQLPTQSRALLRSQGGQCAGKVLTVLPTSSLTTVPSAEFRVLVLRRLHLPLPFTSSRCRCGRPLDSLGHHRAACSTCGVLRKRGRPLEKAAARVCREAGARVAENVLLRAMNLNGISAHDGREIEVVATGLPLFGGAQLAVDTTLVAPLSRDGRPHPRCATVDGAQLQVARVRKERKYHELLASRRCRLVVLAFEVGGRWSEESLTFVRLLAKAKSRAAPAVLQQSVRAAFHHRWTGILAVAAQRAFAASLLDLPMEDALGVDGDTPPLENILGDARLWGPALPSRVV